MAAGVIRAVRLVAGSFAVVTPLACGRAGGEVSNVAPAAPAASGHWCVGGNRTADSLRFAGFLVPERPPVAAGIAGQMPAHPRSFYRHGFRARAVADFVVDTSGRVIPSSIRVDSATPPEYARWVCQAVRALRFMPAEHEGQRVPARVRQPFGFSAAVREREG